MNNTMVVINIYHSHRSTVTIMVVIIISGFPMVVIPEVTVVVVGYARY